MPHEKDQFDENFELKKPLTDKERLLENFELLAGGARLTNPRAMKSNEYCYMDQYGCVRDQDDDAYSLDLDELRSSSWQVYVNETKKEVWQWRYKIRREPGWRLSTALLSESEIANYFKNKKYINVLKFEKHAGPFEVES